MRIDGTLDGEVKALVRMKGLRGGKKKLLLKNCRTLMDSNYKAGKRQVKGKRVPSHTEMKMGDREELEKILPEKMEKEEEWSERGIGGVKPVYIGRKKHVYTVKLGELAEIPGSPYAYWASKSLRELFWNYPPLDRDLAGQKEAPKIADVKQGLATADDSRFTRFWWEVNVDNIATSREKTYHKKWVPYDNDVYLFYFYNPITVVVDWNDEGLEIKNYKNLEGKLLSRPQNVNFYFLPGIVWSCGIQRSQLKKVYGLQRIPCRVMREGCIFGVAAQGIIPKDKDNQWWLLALLCSRVIFWSLRLIVSDKMPGTGPCANLSISEIAYEGKNKLENLAKEAYSLLREHDTGNEPSTHFIMPWLLQAWRGFSQDWKPVKNHPLARDFEWSDFESAKELRGKGKRWDKEASIIALANECVHRELKQRKRLDEIQTAIDDAVYRIYGISEEDRRLNEEEISTVEPGEEKNETETEENQYEVLPAEEHIKRLLFYFGLEIMKEDEDGIVPVSDMFLGTRKEPGMATRLITKLNHEFGEENLDRIEAELTNVLKMRIEDWFAKDFFAYHTTLYRLRPVIWQLSSAKLRQGKEKPAFSCFIYWHKLDADTIPKARQLYLKPVFEASRMEIENIKAKLSKVEGREKREVENELESALTKYEELKTFDEAFEKLLKPHEIRVTSKSNRVKEKVKEITENGYKPERDYGVRVNIEPLKQAGVMPKTADRVKG